MDNMMTTTAKNTLNNGLTLAAQTKAIDGLLEKTKKNLFEICVRLAIIDEHFTEELKDDGYKNTAEYAAAVFGLARSTTLNYIKIARTYLQVTPIEGKKKSVRISTICAKTDDDGETVDYKIGQLNALGKTTAGDFEIMHKEGVISPDMSADNIRKAVKEWYEPEEDDEPEEEPEEVTELEEEPEEADDEPESELETIKKHIDAALDICARGNVAGEIAAALQDALRAVYDEMGC